MSRQMIYAQFVQCRAYDGLKRSETDTIMNKIRDLEKWIQRQVESYKAHKARVANKANARPRLAYVVKVYLKENPNDGI